MLIWSVPRIDAALLESIRKISNSSKYLVKALLSTAVALEGDGEVSVFDAADMIDACRSMWRLKDWLSEDTIDDGQGEFSGAEQVEKRTDFVSRSRHFRDLLSDDVGTTHLRNDTSSPRHKGSSSLPLDARPTQRSTGPSAHNFRSRQTFDAAFRDLPRLSSHLPTISPIDS